MEWTRSDLIEAPVERVWDLTIDVEAWPELLPTVDKVTRLDPGPLRTGSQVHIDQPGLSAVWTVRAVEPAHLFAWETTWRGRALVAEHRIDSVDGGSRNTLRLELGGRRPVVLGALLGPLMRLTLAREARAFRRTAEAKASASQGPSPAAMASAGATTTGPGS